MASVEIPAISILIGFFLSYLALGAATIYAAAPEKASVSAVITGNVFCDACSEGRPSQNGYVISGASVALECRLNRKTMILSITGETDENGEFQVEVPSNIFQSADQLNKCLVKPLKSPDNSCRIPSKSAPSSLTLLQSESNGVVTYSAGSFSYRHETAPASCYTKGVLRMKRGRAVAENFDQNWEVNPKTYTDPSDPSLQWFGSGNAPFFPPGTPSGFPKFLPGTPGFPGFPKFPKFPPGTPFVFPPFPKFPPGSPFSNWPPFPFPKGPPFNPGPGTPGFPNNPSGPPSTPGFPDTPPGGPSTPGFPDTPPSSGGAPPFSQPTPTTPNAPFGEPTTPGSGSAPFGEPTSPGFPPQGPSNAPFGEPTTPGPSLSPFASATQDDLKAELESSIDQDLKSEIDSSTGQDLKSELESSTNPSRFGNAPFSQPRSPGFPKFPPGVFPPFPKFPPGIFPPFPFPKFPPGVFPPFPKFPPRVFPPFPFPGPGTPGGFPGTPDGPPTTPGFPPLPDTPPGDAPFEGPTTPGFPPLPDNAPFSGPTSPNFPQPPSNGRPTNPNFPQPPSDAPTPGFSPDPPSISPFPFPF